VYIGVEGYDPEPGPFETPLEAKRRILESKYRAQSAEPHFKELLDSVDYLAIWDNHDFGLPGLKYSGLAPKYGAEVPEPKTNGP